MLIDQVKARIEQLGDYVAKVEEAAELDAVFRDPTKLQTALRAFVVPLGRNASPAKLATGFHSQMVERFVGVGLAIRVAGDVTGRKSSAEIETREDEMIDQLVAWTPDGFASPLKLVRTRLRDFRDGMALLQLDFSTTSYLRKATT